MNTRDALRLLSKGKIDNAGVVGPLYEQSAKYLDQFEAREAGIKARQERDIINVPALVALRNKVAAAAGTPERETPVAMRFYAHQAIKAASLRQPKDRGLSMLAKHMEKLWTEDPMGSLNLGQVIDLRAHYSDSYPTSKVAKVFDKEIKKVGYSNLPVAKLARIAAKITDQSDFDNAVLLAGLAGDRQDQISARTLIRNLVEARGASLTPEASEETDDLSTSERVAKRVAQFMDDELPDVVPDVELPLDPNTPVEEGVEEEFPLDPNAPAEEGVDGDLDAEVGELAQLTEEVEEFIEDSAPPQAQNYIDVEHAEGQGTPGTAEWGFQEAEEGHTAPPPSKQWQDEELAEHAGEGMESVQGGPVVEEEEFPIGEMPIEAIEHKHACDDAMDPPTAPADGQYERRNNDAPDRGKDGGAELEKNETKKASLPSAAEVETAILDNGNAYKIGSSAIFVNDNDEVEIHTKSGSYACSIRDIDRAIGDFLKVAAHEAPKPVKKIATYEVVTLVPVPCARCAAVVHFEAATDSNDIYECECGHQTKAATISGLIKLGHISKLTNYRVKMPPEVAADAGTKQIFLDSMEKMKSTMPGLQVAPHGEFMFDVSTSDSSQVPAIQKRLHELGVDETKLEDTGGLMGGRTEPKLSQRPPNGKYQQDEFEPAEELTSDTIETDLNQMSNPKKKLGQMGAPVPPGGADMPIAQEVVPQGLAAPQTGGQATPVPQEGATPDGQAVNNKIAVDDIQAAFKHYKSMGMDFLEAIGQFQKDYKERIEAHWAPELNAAVIDTATTLYTNQGAAPQPAAPMAPTAAMKARAAAILHKAFSTPKVLSSHPAKHKSPTDMGKDTEGDKGFTEPAVKVKHPAKHKSPTDMGKDTEGKDPGSFKAPKPAKDGKQPGAGSQPGTKAVPDKSLGKDTSGKDPGSFKASKPKSSIKAGK